MLTTFPFANDVNLKLPYMMLLIVLDPPTFRDYPQYEVPTRPHIVWSKSPSSGW